MEGYFTEKDWQRRNKNLEEAKASEERAVLFKKKMIDQAARTGNRDLLRQVWGAKVIDKKGEKARRELKLDDIIQKRKARRRLEKLKKSGDLPSDYDTDAVMRKQKPAKSKKELMVEKALSNNDSDLMQRVIGGEFDERK